MKIPAVLIPLNILLLFLFQPAFAAADGGNFKSTGQLNTCTARHECSFVQAGENFYLMGGRETNQIEQYNFATKTWTGKATAPIAIHHFQALHYGGLIWAVCGMTTKNDSGFPNEPNLPNIYMYDLLQNIWIKGVAIPAARQRGSSGVVNYKNKFYILSGNNHGHNCGGQFWTDRYDPATNSWTPLKDGPRKRDHYFAMILNDKIYAVGGRHSSSGCSGGTFGNTHKEVDIYDIPTDTWSTLSTLAFVDRAAPVTGILGNEIVALGGEHATNTSTTIITAQALDLTTHIWRTLKSLPTSGDAQGRHATQGIVSNGVLWAAAGSKSMGGNKINTFFGYYTDNANAANMPSGTPITPGTFTFSSTRVSFPDSGSSIKTNSVTLNHTSGNQGILISDITISQNGFALTNKNSFPWFLAPNSTLSIEIAFDPKANTSQAQMTIFTVVPGAKQYLVTLEKAPVTKTIQGKHPVVSSSAGSGNAARIFSINGRLISNAGNGAAGDLSISKSTLTCGLKVVQVKSRTGEAGITRKSFDIE